MNTIKAVHEQLLHLQISDLDLDFEAYKSHQRNRYSSFHYD